MSKTYFALAGGNLTQSWGNAGLITANDDWSGVPSIVGYLGDIDAGSLTAVDPRTLTGADSGAVDVIANQSNPNTLTSGGVAEFDGIANPTIALNGSGTADAPSLVLYLDATGRQNVTVAFNARDIDGSTDDAAQQLNVQYRIGGSGSWTNVTGGYIADATTKGAATQVTPVSVVLPAEVNGQAQVEVRILTTNAAGNDEWVGIDDIVVSSSTGGSGPQPASIASLTVDAGSKAEGESFQFTVTLSEAATADTVVSLSASGATGDIGSVPASVTVLAGQTSASFTIASIDDAVAEPDEAFAITATLGGSSRQASATILNNDGTPLTLISAVQGAGSASALVGKTVTVEAIVVGDFQNGDGDSARNLGGFWLQEEATDSDGNVLTSEGIFVSAAQIGTDVHLGDKVRVTGTVAESFGNTELNATAVSVVQAGAVADVNTMAAVVDLPANGVQTASNGTYVADLERYEGMLVRFAETLTVTEQFNLDQFGEIRLTEGGRPNSYTVDHAPSSAGYDAHLRDIASRSIVFDDGRSVSNPDLDNTVVDGDYNARTAPRMGDTITGLTGVIDYDFNQFRVHAIQNGAGINDVVSANARPANPPDVGGTLKLASFNVENYFTTLDNGGRTANGFEPRGAETQAELDRQTAKLVNTLVALDADVIGLMELENNFTEGASGNAIAHLVAELNSVSGSMKFDWVRPGRAFVGGDAIAVGFIYDVTSVKVSFDSHVAILDDSLVSADLLAQSTTGHIFDGANTSRAALAVTFEEIATGGEFTAVVNHFKSKGGTGTGVDADAKDGAGAWNNQRDLAAKALVDWLGTNPTGSSDPDKIVLGDLNAYAKEAPIQRLVAAGFTDRDAGDYGYVFDGQKGSLDHVMTSASLGTQVTGAASWHINADEADAVDYQLNFNGDLTTNERDPSIFDAKVLARVSDHDPIVLGLDLTEKPVNTPAFTLQLLHFSDAEAGLLAGSTAKNLAALVDAFDDQYANTLILSGGDNFIPGPFISAGTDPNVRAAINAATGSTIAAGTNQPIAAADIAILNAIGIDASTIGNHDFDLGSRVLRDAITPNSVAGWKGANFAYLSSNLDFSADADLVSRYTNTVGNGAVATPEVSTLKGRIAPAAIITKGGEKIGLIGATTQILERISSPTGTEVKGFPGDGAEVDDMDLLASQLQPIIDELTAEGVTKIVLQTHLQQLGNEKLLATKLHGVDIILAAGSHTRLGDSDDVAASLPGHEAEFQGPYPIVTAGTDGKPTLIVNTDNEYTYLGRLVVDFDAAGNVIVDDLAAATPINGAYAATGENVAEAWNTSVENLGNTAFAEGTKGDKVRDVTDAVQSIINLKDGTVHGFTDVYLEGDRAAIRNQETNFGDLTADANAQALRDALGADSPLFIVSLKNGGGVRAPIGTVSSPDPVTGEIDKLPPPANEAVGKPAGGVSQLDIENALRFDNKLMAFDTTAAGLKAILESGVAALGNQGRFPQIGGVAFSYDPDLPAGSRISDIALVGENGVKIALYDNGVLQAHVPAKITMIALSYIANGGDSYPVKANAENFRYLLSDGGLSAPVDEALDFTAAAVVAANTPAGSTLLGEQQAFANYMHEVHGTKDKAFDVADTPEALDERIQNLNVRGDSVLDGAQQVPVGTSGDDELEGTVLDDAISAGAGDDVVFAGAGNDTVDGGTGDDELHGEAGNDTLRGGEGDDLLVGGAGNDRLEGGEGDDTLEGGEGDDILIGGAGSDTLIGGAGNDSITAGAGDTVEAGAGDDVIVVEGEAGDWTGVDAGEGNDEVINLSSGRIAGGLMLGAGNDKLANSGLIAAGADGVAVDMGAGDDVVNLYIGSQIGGAILLGEGNDRLTADMYMNADLTVDGGAGDDQITTSFGNDTIFGGAGNDLIFAEAGNDRIDAGAGDDTILADLGDDVIDGGEGFDTLDLSRATGPVTVDFAAGKVSGAGIGSDSFRNIEKLLFGASNDTVTGGDGNDAFDGGAGNDTLKGGAGADTLWGGTGDDRLDGGSGDDALSGGIGNDQLKGGSGNDRIEAGEGDDTVDAGSGDDVILGGAGKDVIDAGSGDDRIEGGAGNDTLTGGSGHDVFVFAAGFGKDMITDFRSSGASADVLEISVGLFADFDAAMSHAAQVGADTVFSIDADTTLTLKGVQLATLAQDDFRFV